MTHSKLKTWWALRLEEWAEGRGYAAMSWDFRFAPPGEPLRPMCPDVAYLSFERAAHLSDEELQAPPIAPDGAIEVLMRNERYIAYKRKLYLACGSLVFITVSSDGRIVTAHDAHGARTYTDSERFAHPALPGFSFDMGDMVGELRFQ